MKLPAEFIEKYRRILGSDANDFIASFDQVPINAFRVEPLRSRTDFSSYQSIPSIPHAHYGKISGLSIEFLSGVLYSQEPSAMYPAQILAPRPGDLVLDLCAAPGGKATALASQLHNDGFVLANDIDLKRSKILAENVGRMGYQNVAVSNMSPEDLAAQFPTTFTKILVDAPCSGEGMFRKDPAAVNYWNPDYPANCAKTQKKILREAIKMLAPGGTLVYSTCTFSPEEDEGVVAEILNSNPELSLEMIEMPPGGAPGVPDYADGNSELAKCLRLYPHLFKGEGQFIAKFRKSGQLAPVELKYGKNVKISPVFEDFMQATFKSPLKNVIVLDSNYYVLNPAFYELIKDLHLIKKGVKIGEMKKQRFVAHQEIFLALPQENYQTVIELDDEQFKNYIHGEELTIESFAPQKKWAALSYKCYIFGFGHWVQNRIKNFYPKNLRR